MEDLGIPFLLIICVISSFVAILKAVDKLNVYRDIVLNIDVAGERLTHDQKSILLNYNYLHLLIGVVFLCIILSSIVIALPAVLTTATFWDRICIYIVFVFIFTSTVSITLTSILSMRKMYKFINSMIESEQGSS